MNNIEANVRSMIDLHGRIKRRSAALQIGMALWYTLERPRPFTIRKADLEGRHIGSALEQHYAGISQALRDGRINPK